MTDYIGQQLGKYQITQLLGTGGFAEVYLGVHIHLGTEAAIKLLHTQLATPADVEKFRQEARTIASLTHPNIVRVLDFDVQDSTPYLVMDYAPNGSLRQHLAAGRPLAPAEILPYLAQVADALQYAHDKKLVHRDIKPENMLLGRRGEVLLSDFGIATVAQSTTSQKTEGVAGTAAYMAPEQIQGKARPSSDLYSLAVIVYEWLAGERPFQGTFTEVATQHLFAPPPPLREKVPTISPLIEQVVLTALAKNPKDRFGTVRAFANAFAQASGADPSTYTFSTRAAAPDSAPAAAQGSQPGITVTAANQLTPHVTPQFTPQAALPSAPGAAAAAPANIAPAASPAPPALSSTPEQQGNQLGLSVLFSPTQLIQPAALTSLPPGGSGPYAPPAPFPTGPTVPDPPGSVTYQPQGWAAAPGSVPFSSQREARVASPVLPPPAPPGAAPGGKPRKGLRVALIVLAAVLALALVGGAAAYGLSLILHSPTTGHPPSTAATVTITPARSDVSNTFNITAVTGSPDSSQNQVSARMLSVTTQPYSQTVNTTGQQTTPGTSASGTLVVYNFDTVNPLNLVPGDLFSNNSGCTPSSLQVVLDGNLNLAAAPPGSYTSGTVPGHVNQVGSGGNFPYLAYHTLRSPAAPLSGCSPFGYESGACGGAPSYCWGIFNQGPFTGGTDPQTYPVVTQSDIDNAANSLIQANQPDAQQLLQGHLQTNERLIGTAQCTHQISSDHSAGDQASQVTVTVTFTCTGEAYDYGGALTLAATLLENQAASNPGAGYALVGKIKTSQVSATSGGGGSVAIAVSAEGIWAYQFSNSQKQNLANLIAGKNKQDALNLLQAQTGVAQVSIQITSGDGQTLPTQPNQITIDIQTVSGL